MYINYGIKSEPSTYFIAGVIRSRKYKITEQATINIVIVEPYLNETIKQYIDYNFDLSFCCTKYDGKVFNVTDLTMHGIGYIQTLGHYKQREPYHYKNPKKHHNQSNLYYPDIDKILQHRINKYTTRGFTIYCLLDILNKNSMYEDQLLRWTSGIANIIPGPTTNVKIFKFIDDIELENCKNIKNIPKYDDCSSINTLTPPIIKSILEIVQSVNTLENMWLGLDDDQKKQWLSKKSHEVYNQPLLSTNDEIKDVPTISNDDEIKDVPTISNDDEIKDVPTISNDDEIKDVPIVSINDNTDDIFVVSTNDMCKVNNIPPMILNNETKVEDIPVVLNDTVKIDEKPVTLNNTVKINEKSTSYWPFNLFG
jgi:hypothetical protein